MLERDVHLLYMTEVIWHILGMPICGTEFPGSVLFYLESYCLVTHRS